MKGRKVEMKGMGVKGGSNNKLSSKRKEHLTGG